MSKKQRQQVELTETEVEGMMASCWGEGVQKKITVSHMAVCLNNNVWKVIDEQEAVCGFVKPDNCETSIQVREAFCDILP